MFLLAHSPRLPERYMLLNLPKVWNVPLCEPTEKFDPLGQVNAVPVYVPSPAVNPDRITLPAFGYMPIRILWLRLHVYVGPVPVLMRIAPFSYAAKKVLPPESETRNV